MLVAKEQIRQIITDNNICSEAGVYVLLQNGIKDILHKLTEDVFDAILDYEKKN